MSPVSRGRKKKRSSKRAVTDTAGAQRTNVQPAAPAARGPRKLEQLIAELLGGELHRTIQEGNSGLWVRLVDCGADPVTEAVREMLPEWVRWLSARAGVPEHLAKQAISVAQLQ